MFKNNVDKQKKNTHIFDENTIELKTWIRFFPGFSKKSEMIKAVPKNYEDFRTTQKQTLF